MTLQQDITNFLSIVRQDNLIQGGIRAISSFLVDKGFLESRKRVRAGKPSRKQLTDLITAYKQFIKPKIHFFQTQFHFRGNRKKSGDKITIYTPILFFLLRSDQIDDKIDELNERELDDFNISQDMLNVMDQYQMETDTYEIDRDLIHNTPNNLIVFDNITPSKSHKIYKYRFNGERVY